MTEYAIPYPFSRSSSQVKVADVVLDSVVDGPGLRLAIFTQGCFHNCFGCQNPGTHDPNKGHWLQISDILTLYKQNPLYSGITFSGGEPFLQSKALSVLGKQVHALGGNVVTYTGYVFEDLVRIGNFDLDVRSLLSETDILVDGPYMENLRDLDLVFRGSRNQRVLRIHDKFNNAWRSSHENFGAVQCRAC